MIRLPQPLFDFRFPDFTARHLFTAKLRLAVLVGFWLFATLYVPALLTADPPVMLIFSLLFAVTTLSYLFVLRGKWTALFFVVELIADVASLTLVVYFTGGVRSYFFVLYVLYTLASGLFYNWKVSAVCAAVSFLFYLGLVLAIGRGSVLSYPYPFDAIPFFAKGIFGNGTLLALLLVIAIYGIRLSSHFSQMREQALEAKNLELTARNRVASATRGVLTLDRIADQILRGAREGLGFEASFLVLSEPTHFRLHVEQGRPNAVPISKLLGFDLGEITLPAEAMDSPIVKAMRQKKTVIRYELSELSRGVMPEIPKAVAEEIQKGYGYGKFIVAPLIAEQKILGALVGVTTKAWIESEAIRTLEGYADQAALVLDNARLIEELKEKNVELERVSRAKSDFLAGVSHELRTPLNAILGFSEILLGEEIGKLSPDQRKSLQEITTNGQNLLRLINGLLDLAKIEAGKMEVFLGPVDIGQLILTVRGMVGSLLQKKGQRLEMDVPNLAIVYADEAKLQQVLINLLSNAIKFTPEQGKIVVKVRQEGAGLEVSVEDNGVGIPEHELGKVFDFFHQAKRPMAQKQQGTGLGLALVKQFVELHGGKIWVKSSPGKGSRFTFQLPGRFSVAER